MKNNLVNSNIFCIFTLLKHKTITVMTHSHILNNDDAKVFIFAGKSIITFLSEKGNRFTYRIKKLRSERKRKEGDDLYFVSVLTGPDNTKHYTYIGTVFMKSNGSKVFKITKGSRLPATDIRVKAFNWVIANLFRGTLKGVTIYHEGHCGRCGRLLTVPKSIENGIGPECEKMMKIA